MYEPPVPTFCALREATRLLLLAIQYQAKQLGEGDFRRMQEVDTLYHIVEMIRAGVCRTTRTLHITEVPGLHAALDSLPPSWKRRLVEAIVGETTGQAYHGALIPLVPRELVGTNPRLPAVKPEQPPQWP